MEPLRYVVLRHEEVPEPHFDLMFETSPGSELATWRCDHWPPVEGTSLVRLPDHRRTYLTYEGPVSGGRGVVRAAERGEIRSIEFSRDRCIIALPSFTLTLLDLENNAWRIESIERPSQL